MAEERAKDVCRRWDALKAARGNVEQRFQEIAEIMRPMRADFTLTRLAGERRGLQIFDGTPGVAAENLASGLWSMVTNSANEWFRLSHPDDAMARQADVKLWLDACTRIMRDAFAAGGQRFYGEVLALDLDLVTFGTGLFWSAEAQEPGRLHFSTRALAECVIDQDDEERVDTVIRRFDWTARQAYARWGERAGEPVLKAIGAQKLDQMFCFFHAVEPNPDRDPRRRDARGKAWRSLHVAEAGMQVVQEGGYEEFPYQVPRWSTASRGLYGDSPAMLALADSKTLQAQEKTQMVAAQKAADPPLLVADENALRSVRVTPGGITYGAVDQNGRPLVQPLQTGARFNLTLEMAEQKRDAIRTAFYGALLTMIANPGATATEVLARQEEQLRLMGPHLGRLQSEFHDPLIRRVFGMLWRAGAFPPPPAALMEAPELSVEYVSPLARAQKSSEGAAVMRTLEPVMQLAQARPEVLDNFDMDEVSRGLGDAFGLPARMLRDPRQVAEMRAQQQQQAEAMRQAQMVAGAAKPMADAARGAKDLVSAEAMAGGAA